ncbi:MAG: SDR family oxidoreductase [Gammaproteobacteria bacterium]
MHNNNHTSDSISGKHALVTGAGGGIGSAIVKQLSAAGAKVTLLGRNLSAMQAVAEEVPESCIVQADVTDQTAIEHAFAQARSQFGPIDILVNNAGIAKSAPYLKQSTEDWQQTMDVNLNGVHFGTQAALPDMIAQGWGRVVNIASVAALQGHAYVAAYVAAKHAVLGLTRALALEFANQEITVNAVCPGYTNTDMVTKAVANIVKLTGRTEAQARAELVKDNPQQRLIEPEEVANAVLWLCQPAARGMTGQAITVAGGEVMA